MPLSKRKFAPKNKMIRRKRLARRLRRAPQLTVNRALHPIPQRFITKMKYAESVVTNGIGQYVFNLNSIFDPNATGTGHQPYGFDTLATLYNRYRVISCGYRIQSAAQASSTSGTSYQIAALPSNEVVNILSLSQMKENPRAKYIVQTAGGGAAVLSGKSYIPSLVGRSKAQYMADDRYQALTTASPQELAVLNVLTSFNGSDDSSALTINVLFEYTVEFFDIKSLGQSNL